MDRNSQRATTIELAKISTGRLASPPAPPADTNMRAWFAGLALGNPELMKGVPAGERATEALRLADEMMLALTNKTPSEKSVAAKPEAEMQVWDKHVAAHAAVTVAPRRTQSKVSTKPGIPAPVDTTRDPVIEITEEPAPAKFTWASNMPRTIKPPPPRTKPGMGSYSIIGE